MVKLEICVQSFKPNPPTPKPQWRSQATQYLIQNRCTCDICTTFAKGVLCMVIHYIYGKGICCLNINVRVCSPIHSTGANNYNDIMHKQSVMIWLQNCVEREVYLPNSVLYSACQPVTGYPAPHLSVMYTYCNEKRLCIIDQ